MKSKSLPMSRIHEESLEDKTNFLKGRTTKLQKRLGDGVWVDKRSIVRNSDARRFFGAVSQTDDTNETNDSTQSQLGKKIKELLSAVEFATCKQIREIRFSQCGNLTAIINDERYLPPTFDCMGTILNGFMQQPRWFFSAGESTMGALFRPPKIIVTAVFSSLGAFTAKFYIEVRIGTWLHLYREAFIESYGGVHASFNRWMFP